jgi:oligopeptidase B
LSRIRERKAGLKTPVNCHLGLHQLKITRPGRHLWCTTSFLSCYATRIISRQHTSNIRKVGDDVWNQYRKPVTKELWNELSTNVAVTRKWAARSPLYQQMYHEIQENVRQAWEDPEPIADYGPTGKYLYKLVVRLEDNFKIYQRYSTSADGQNPQQIVEIEPQVELLSMSLSPDETYIASLIQKSSDESQQKEIRIQHIATGNQTTLAFEPPNDEFSIDNVMNLEWGPSIENGNDDETAIQTLYVVLSDTQGRPCQVSCCFISLHSKASLIHVYRSDDPTVMVDVQRTKGCQYVAIEALSKTSNEIHLCHNPTEPLLLVKPRIHGTLYHLDVGVNKDIVILISQEHSNDGNYCLFETTIDALPLEQVIDMKAFHGMNRDGFFIHDMDLFQDFLVLYERSKQDGRQRMRIHRRQAYRDSLPVVDPEESEIAIIEPTSVDGKISPIGNINFYATSLRYQVESPVNPGCIYEFSFKERRVIRLSQHCKMAGNNYVRDVVFAKSRDGTAVPMSLYYDPTRQADKRNNTPIILMGYGAYGEPANLNYDPSLGPLLERGAVVAVAHTRGGGELGKAWYYAGRHRHKKRGIEDFEACAIYLQSLFGGRPLSSKVFSAGGVLLGAVINSHPNLFDKVVFTNAFLDVLATMRNPSLFLTEHEYDEFGNPNNEIEGIIQSYCPISNLDPEKQVGTKTKILIISTLDDANVPYWNGTLYFKKLTSRLENNQRKAFLHLQTVGGHDISGQNRILVWSLENTFLLDENIAQG